ncbi:MAG: cytochrome c3 family protein [Verrucomicrobiota bacterium]
MGTATSQGAAPALQGSINIRPLTPTELTKYSLPATTETSGGLNTIGVGQPAYLDALVNAAIAPSNIVSVVWTITNAPIGSAAVLSASPLGTNVPPFNMADIYNNSGGLVYQVAGRTVLRPDLPGQYAVKAVITTAGGSGTTNLVQLITAGTYVGLNNCALCHSGGIIASNIVTPWSGTPHATFFTRAIDGQVSSHYSKNCISCHVVGYDTNTNAVNGGFDDIANQLGWNFPTVLTNGNWAAMPSALQNLANIQCENCHGPGSEHAAALGNTNVSNWPRVAVNYWAGDCAVCHDATPQHIHVQEWNASGHAVAPRTPSGPTRNNCVRCHTAGGFEGYSENINNTNKYATNTVYQSIGCQACHDPHQDTNPHQLRLGYNVVLPDGTVVTNAGSGGFCMNCHMSRNGSASNNVANYKAGLPTWPGGSSFGVHDSPQGDMLEGVNAITYGKAIPSAAHRSVITNTCAGCHMQPIAATDPAYLKAGAHTMNMSYMNGTNEVDVTAVCVQCHGQITDFNMLRGDFNGDGVIEGVQTEVQHLLDKLTTYLPNTNGVVDGLVKTPSVKTNWTMSQLNAAYNWQFVNNDGSKGIHNAPFAVGLLKASIADLNGDSNNDGLPDWWQTQYFGSPTNSLAAPNATPAGDGVPNWLKYSLGLNPTVPGMVLPDGVMWANGTALVDGGNTNSIRIYTAAEVVFDTQAGKTYQLQETSSLSSGWQPIGSPIAGTGASMSYLTATRTNVQQFFRVVSQ